MRGDIEVQSKADLVEKPAAAGLWISAKTGEGIGQLIDLLAEYAEKTMSRGEAPTLSRARHRLSVKNAARHLQDTLDASAPELAAEHLRLGLREIGRLTGRVDLDELLDVVFRDFCLGK
jgi:tRNA modification GTPase